MTHKKNEAGTLLPMTVTEGVTVNVLPNEAHEYLMTTTEVARGYGVTPYVIRMNKMRLNDELIEGKHYVNAVTICYGEQRMASKIPHNAVLWTKRGIVRLGFAMRGERAKLFRDWAEELIITVSDRVPEVRKMIEPVKRKHNRLTQERLLDIMGDVCQISDHDLRIRISNKLMGGTGNGTV